MLLPPHCLHLLRCRTCWQMPVPPQSLRWRVSACSHRSGSLHCPCTDCVGVCLRSQIWLPSHSCTCGVFACVTDLDPSTLLASATLAFVFTDATPSTARAHRIFPCRSAAGGRPWWTLVRRGCFPKCRPEEAPVGKLPLVLVAFVKRCRCEPNHPVGSGWPPAAHAP